MNFRSCYCLYNFTWGMGPTCEF